MPKRSGPGVVALEIQLDAVAQIVAGEVAALVMWVIMSHPPPEPGPWLHRVRCPGTESTDRRVCPRGRSTGGPSRCRGAGSCRGVAACGNGWTVPNARRTGECGRSCWRVTCILRRGPYPGTCTCIAIPFGLHRCRCRHLCRLDSRGRRVAAASSSSAQAIEFFFQCRGSSWAIFQRVLRGHGRSQQWLSRRLGSGRRRSSQSRKGRRVGIGVSRKSSGCRGRLRGAGADRTEVHRRLLPIASRRCHWR